MTIDLNQVGQWAKTIMAVAAVLGLLAGAVRAYDRIARLDQSVETMTGQIEAINLNVRDLLIADCERRGVPPLDCLPRPMP